MTPTHSVSAAFLLVMGAARNGASVMAGGTGLLELRPLRLSAPVCALRASR